jgi:hypothetical protein
VKKIIIAMMFLGLTGIAEAAPEVTANVISTTFTVVNVAISSYTATKFLPTSAVMANRKALFVQGVSTDIIHCSPSASMTYSGCIAGTVAQGCFILPTYTQPMLFFPIRATGPVEGNALTFYCMTSNSSASSLIAVIQGY